MILEDADPLNADLDLISMLKVDWGLSGIADPSRSPSENQGPLLECGPCAELSDDLSNTEYHLRSALLLHHLSIQFRRDLKVLRILDLACKHWVRDRTEGIKALASAELAA